MIFQSGYWEYLYLWPNLILNASGRLGLIEVQIFCQWIHVAFGLGGTALALHALFRKYGLKGPWLALAILGAMASGSGFWTAHLAKSEWGLVSWMLYALVLLLEPLWDRAPVRPVRALFAGILMGAVISSKLPFAYLGVAFGVSWLFVSRDGKAAAIVVLGALVAGCPIWIRNFIYAGDPVYPLLNGWFQGPLIGPSYEQFNHAFLLKASDLTIAHYASIFGTLFNENPLFALLPFGLGGVLWLRRPLGAALGVLLGALAGSAALFALSVGFVFLWRYSLLTPVLANGIAIVLLSRLSNACAKAGPRAGVAYAIALLGVAFQLKAGDVLRPPEHLFADRMDAVRGQIGGDTKAWLRQHAKASDPIVSMYDPQIYYLAGLDLHLLEWDPALDRATFDAKTPAALCQALQALKPRFLFESWEPQLGGVPWGRRMALLRPVVDRHPDAVLYRGRESRVMDPDKLCAYAATDPVSKQETEAIYTP